MKLLTVISMIGLGVALIAAQPANAAFVGICDADSCPTMGLTSTEPNITFGLNDFEFGFQINSVTVQQGLGNPATVAISEVGAPPMNIIDGAAENDFSAVWILGGSINPENETIFFINPNDPRRTAPQRSATFSTIPTRRTTSGMATSRWDRHLRRRRLAAPHR